MSRTLASLVLAASCALPAACHVPAESSSGIPDALTSLGPEQRLAHGNELYARHCAVCHGETGRGDGPAAEYLFPPARRFDAGRFRLVSSVNGAPFDRDLVATLRRGIPGSAMPAWGWLGEEDLWSLAATVRALAEEGLGDELRAQARSSGDTLLLAGADRIARERMTPDRALVVPATVVATTETILHGRRVFLDHCASCHGEAGTGETEPRRDEDGTLNWARDFTAGFLEGGDAVRDLACRIRAGMPGTAMPPTELARDDELALIAFVRSLIPPGTSGRLVHRRSTLVARRTAAAPAVPDDPAWQEAEEIDVVLAPLWWHEKAVLGASLAALHDGRTLALRLSWSDETGDLHVFTGTRTSDAAAVELSVDREPALFGMGAAGHPTNLWHWKALRLEDVAGALDLLDPRPHLLTTTRPGEVRTDVPLYARIEGRLDPSARVDRITPEGTASMRSAERVPGEVAAAAHWSDGRWSVVFTRSLAVRDAAQVALTGGRPYQVACAVWNGAAGDSGARKSISIWQELVLEP